MRLVPEIGLVDVADQGLPERLAGKVSEQLEAFAAQMRQGLLAASVTIGLDVMGELVDAEVADIGGRKGRHDANRVAYRPGSGDGKVAPLRSVAEGEACWAAQLAHHFAATERPSHPVHEQSAERSAGAERGAVRRPSRPPKSRRRLRPERRWDGTATEAPTEPVATAAERNGNGQTTEKPTPTITIRVESEFDLMPEEVFGQRVPPKFTAADVVAVMEAEGPKPEVRRRWYLDDPGLVTVTVRRRTAEAWASSPGRPRAAQR